MEQIDFVNEAGLEKEVLRSPLPTVVDFYAEWCGPCRTISPILEELSREYAGRVKFVKIDVDDNQVLAQRYEIASIPTVMIFAGGRPGYVIIGATSKEHYKKSIERVLNSPQEAN